MILLNLDVKPLGDAAQKMGRQLWNRELRKENRELLVGKRILAFLGCRPRRGELLGHQPDLMFAHALRQLGDVSSE